MGNSPYNSGVILLYGGDRWDSLILVNGCLKIAANDALSSFETSLKRQKIGHPLRGPRQQLLLEE